MSLHQVVCGRQRKNIKVIESSTGTAIYFPSPFSQVYRYCPPNAKRRDPNDILITGETPQAIELAKQKIHDTVTRIRLYIKDVNIPAAKIDSIILSRLDKVRKILEANGTFVLFPTLGAGKSMVRVQGNEGLHVERTVREIMSLVRLRDFPMRALLYSFLRLHFLFAFFTNLIICRLGNFTVRPGFSYHPTATRWHPSLVSFPVPTIFGPCWAMYAPIRTPTYPWTTTSS